MHGLNNKIILIGFFLILFSVFVNADYVGQSSLPSYPFSLEGTTIQSNNFSYSLISDGLVRASYGGTPLTDLGFLFYGEDPTPTLLTSWGSTWNWSVLSNTDENITVDGTTSRGGFDWQQIWAFDEETNRDPKITHVATNNTGSTYSNAKLCYVMDINSDYVSSITYFDDTNTARDFVFGETADYSTNELLNFTSGKIFFNGAGASFDFTDLFLDFNVNYLFAGNLNNAYSELPDSNGLVVCFTKGSGVFLNGLTITADPTFVGSSPGASDYYNPLTSGHITNTDHRYMFISNKFYHSGDAGATWSDFNVFDYTAHPNAVMSIHQNTKTVAIVFRDTGVLNYWYRECTVEGDVVCDSNSDFSVPISLTGAYPDLFFGDASYVMASQLVWQQNTERIYFAFPRGAGTNITMSLLYADGNKQDTANWIYDENVIGTNGTYNNLSGYSVDVRDDNTLVVMVIKRNANTYMKAYYSLMRGGLWSHSDVELGEGLGADPYKLAQTINVRLLHDVNIFISVGFGQSSTVQRIPYLIETNFDSNVSVLHDLNDYYIGTSTYATTDPLTISIDKNDLAFIGFHKNSGSPAKDITYIKTYRYSTDALDTNVTVDDANLYNVIHLSPILDDGKLNYFYTNTLGGIYWDEFQASPSNITNSSPDVNIVYPNSDGLSIGGTKNFDLNFYDEDFNSSGDYNLNINVRRPDTNATTLLVGDANAFDYCTNMDANNTIKVCTVSFNVSANLSIDVNYTWDANIIDDLEAVGSATADYNFTVNKIVIDENVLSSGKLLDLTVDGVNYGEDSEEWIQDEIKTNYLNTPSTDRNQFLIVKALNDNTTLSFYINNILVGTKDANASDPQTWQWYIFEIEQSNLISNPQAVKIEAGATQDPTYIDFIALFDTVDSNIISGGDAVLHIWDVNYNGLTETSNQFVFDQNGTETIVDANTMSLSAFGEYFAVIEATDLIDQNGFAWIKIIAEATTYESDTNKTAIIDSTDPVVNSVSMTYFSVIANTIVALDSNGTDLYLSSAKLFIEGVEYDLNVQAITGNDWNGYGDFNFTSSGTFAITLAFYDAVDRNGTYDFNVFASTVSGTGASDIQDTNYSRENAIDVNSTEEFIDVAFRINWDFVASGDGNITYHTFNDVLYNGHDTNELRGKVINVNLIRENKSTVDLDDLITQTGMTASDLNGTVSIQDYLSYDVNNAIAVQFNNTGGDDARLVHITLEDVNTTLTEFWVKVEVRSPYDPSSYKMVFKECTEGINFGAGTCTQWTAYNIYDQADATFNGSVFPTTDEDEDTLKDTIYFKVSTLSAEHLFYLDLTTDAEPIWTATTGTSSSTSSSTSSEEKEESEGIVEDAVEEVKDWFTGFTFLGNFSEAIGGLIGGLFAWAGLQYERVFAQGLLSGANLFTLISVVIIAVVFFLLVPQTERKTRSKTFGVGV